MSGSRPLPLDMTASAGMGVPDPTPSVWWSARTAARTDAIRVGVRRPEVGWRRSPSGRTRRARDWNHSGPSNACPSSSGPDHLAIDRDEAPVGAVGHRELRDTGDGERVDHAEQDGEDQEHPDPGEQLTAHQPNLSPVTSRSTSLIPMNGATTPPEPVDRQVPAEHQSPPAAAGTARPGARAGSAATMMSALKITADRIADCELCSLMTLSVCSPGNTLRTSRG